MKSTDLPDVWFGSPESEQPDWREMDDEEDPDDEELAETPPLVIATLGYDPKDMDDE